ncbi:MAG: FAD:protein FMN transferase [Bacteroidota bacterium]|nr:FAD:protein FMN transferase [Bacteroidota bacterium]
MRKKTLIIFFTVVICVAGVAGLYFSLKLNAKYIHNEGEAQGTTYSVTYQQPEGIDLQKKIEKRLHEFDLSLSTYVPQSIISRINRNDSTVRTDADFEDMYQEAMEVSKQTNGAFDITVGPLVKAWGFGFGNSDHSKIPDVTKILPYVGYHKIRIVNHKLVKDDPHILVDANALAQGQSSDIIAKLLEDNGCKNYMIEIGGEIVCKGLNKAGKKWQIGIDKPIDDPTNTVDEIQTVLSVSNCGLTTSGNYRKFYYLNGKKYAHEIDPRNGYPVVHNLLSATVVASTCIQADAYATAFMVIGVDSSLQVCKSVPNLDCYLIYTDKNGRNRVVYTEGFKKYLTR